VAIGEAPPKPAAIHVDVHNLELRARNLYTGAPVTIDVPASEL